MVVTTMATNNTKISKKNYTNLHERADELNNVNSIHWTGNEAISERRAMENATIRAIFIYPRAIARRTSDNVRRYAFLSTR